MSASEKDYDCAGHGTVTQLSTCIAALPQSTVV